MVRKIGNFFFVLLLCIVRLHADIKPSISFAITDLDDNPLQVAGIGEPFLMHIKINGKEPINQQPTIEGLDDFYVQYGGPATNYYIINGVSSCTQSHKYILRADKVGNYTVGPVSIASKNGTLTAKSRAITVKDIPERQTQRDISDAFLKIYCEPDHGYIGQKLTLKVRSYATGNALFDRLSHTGFDGFQLGTFIETDAGLEEINGIDYRYTQYEATIVPTQVGKLKIEPMEIEYQIPAQRQQKFGFLAIGPSIEYRRAVSNEYFITVDQLPDNDKVAQAVGVFDSYHASIDQKTVPVNQGIIYTLTLEGDADLEHIQAPELSIPSKVTYYTSKSSIELANVDHGHRKKFEYIIQVQEPGDIEIPAQEFYYFDPSKNQYMMLSTDPQMLTITNDSPKTYAHEEEMHHVISYVEPTDDIYPLNEHGPWVPVYYRIIPFKFFIFLLLLPLLMIVSLWGFQMYQWYYDQHITYFAYKNGFAKADRMLSTCSKSGEAQKVYDLFIQLFAARTHMVPSSITHEYIHELLKKKLSYEQIKQWELFFKDLQEIKFYGKKADHEFYSQSSYWLELFKELL
jgi:BatD DUF11 like domain